MIGKGRKSMIPPPVALGLFLCDQVIVERGTNRASLIGTITSLEGQAFPFVPLPFCVFAVLTGSKGEGVATLTVTQLETDEEVYSVTRRVEFPDRFAEGRLLFRLADCSFPRPGIYVFTITVDNDWVAYRRLRIRQTEIES
jgi:hypothetical protein